MTAGITLFPARFDGSKIITMFLALVPYLPQFLYSFWGGFEDCHSGHVRNTLCIPLDDPSLARSLVLRSLSLPTDPLKLDNFGMKMLASPKVVLFLFYGLNSAWKRFISHCYVVSTYLSNFFRFLKFCLLMIELFRCVKFMC